MDYVKAFIELLSTRFSVNEKFIAKTIEEASFISISPKGKKCFMSGVFCLAGCDGNVENCPLILLDASSTIINIAKCKYRTTSDVELSEQKIVEELPALNVGVETKIVDDEAKIKPSMSLEKAKRVLATWKASPKNTKNVDEIPDNIDEAIRIIAAADRSERGERKKAMEGSDLKVIKDEDAGTGLASFGN